jgi:ribosomal protein S18 acetylase RimI-like enzyme
MANQNDPESVGLQFQLEPELSSAEFVDVLQRSTLAQRRPVDDAVVVAGMLRCADLIVTARASSGLLVGVARSITDFHYCTYLSDLAVDESFQRRGIGKRLIELTHKTAGLTTTLILLSAPAAATYYPHIGLTQHQSCWIIKCNSTLNSSLPEQLQDQPQNE